MFWRKPSQRLIHLILIMISVIGCRNFATKSTVESVAVSQDSFCNPRLEKQLTCTVRDIVTRQNSRIEDTERSVLSRTSKVAMTVFPNGKNKNPVIEFINSGEQAEAVRFENTSDLYHRNGCLAELAGGIFSEGFTPRVSLKVLLSAKNADYAVIAEVSDYRHNRSIHFTLDLQCDRKLVQ